MKSPIFSKTILDSGKEEFMLYRDVPLFPLSSTVLFPHMVLPLQIFEQRYLQMINECVHNNTPFGVLLIQSGDEVQENNPNAGMVQLQMANVGTLAKISEVVKLNDGRLLITSVGTERFRLLSHHNNKPYLSGDIEIWPEDSTTDQDLVKRVQTDFKAYLKVLSELANKRIDGLEMPDDGADLSYIIPNWLLQIELSEKQHLLEINDSGNRLNEESLLLRRETEFLQRIKEQAEQDGTSGDNTPNLPPRGYSPSFPFSRN